MWRLEASAYIFGLCLWLLSSEHDWNGTHWKTDRLKNKGVLKAQCPLDSLPSSSHDHFFHLSSRLHDTVVWQVSPCSWAVRFPCHHKHGSARTSGTEAAGPPASRTGQREAVQENISKVNDVGPLSHSQSHHVGSPCPTVVLPSQTNDPTLRTEACIIHVVHC